MNFVRLRGRLYNTIWVTRYEQQEEISRQTGKRGVERAVATTKPVGGAGRRRRWDPPGIITL